MNALRLSMLCCTAMIAAPAWADEAAVDSDILVTALRQASGSATKTDTPILQTPQPVTIVDDTLFEAQGAVSINDTLRYVAGVTANPYGPDSRTDGITVRGVSALQFRDGMRDIFSYYASIRADPYNFDQVELVRGPASVLFGQGAIGGIFNLVSKMPEKEMRGEFQVRYGSFDRKEALADVTGEITNGISGRIVARVRDADSQTDNVPDDRVMISPSISFELGEKTKVTLLGLYQEDDGGSTAQFLPLAGTILPNPNGQLKNSLFVGKPGWDRYDGRLLQGTGIVSHEFSDNVKLSLKARYIDSDLDYFTHYPNSYSNPTNPYLDPAQRTIALIADASRARMNIFTTDNNLRFDFDTGENVKHVLLTGVDYSWNHVRKIAGGNIELIDIYNINYAALSDYGGGLPQPTGPLEDGEQTQLGLYIQDQVRFYDRVSIVLGARQDWTKQRSFGGAWQKDKATTVRAGVIGDITSWLSPFVSYTESFEPISGIASDGNLFVPKRGRQYEAGVKLHPGKSTLLTITGFHIKESGRPIDDPSTADPFDQMQAGELTTKGFEIEGSTALPGKITLLANYSYNKAQIKGTGVQLENVPKYNASAWATKGFDLSEDALFTLGAGVRYTSRNVSYGAAFPAGIVTPSYTVADAYAEVRWQNWRFSVNATNLFGKDYYSACLARGDCFVGAARNGYATVGYRF
ncbi:TonB-dependent siderophore receptor [Sphingomonas crocodyli]|uniref:TonB-dependent siderophore receptor n=1 Tax=Sphingomonas crocodyli TaxID=1979270 RepID=A0A437MAL3_9SPHN|nr:TonB-dependent siderophore receptor [Sphingomonas crocodyli]RVT94682.1 TonB-dependent siderophore receptor [Sphingomonas crocodyli]